MSENQQITFEDKVSSKIKETFIDLMSDEEWQERVKAEIKAFFEPDEELRSVTLVTQTGSWLNDHLTKQVVEGKISPFRSMVWGHIVPMVKVILENNLTREFVDDIVQDAWDGSPDKEDAKRAWVHEAVQRSIADFFGSMFLNNQMKLRNTLQQELYNRLQNGF